VQHGVHREQDAVDGKLRLGNATSSIASPVDANPDLASFLLALLDMRALPNDPQSLALSVQETFGSVIGRIGVRLVRLGAGQGRRSRERLVVRGQSWVVQRLVQGRNIERQRFVRFRPRRVGRVIGGWRRDDGVVQDMVEESISECELQVVVLLAEFTVVG
jgi:hypothetical protein